jgi:hypothetical protein
MRISSLFGTMGYTRGYMWLLRWFLAGCFFEVKLVQINLVLGWLLKSVHSKLFLALKCTDLGGTVKP